MNLGDPGFNVITLTLSNSSLEKCSQMLQSTIFRVSVIRNTKHIRFHKVLITGEGIEVVSRWPDNPDKAIWESLF